MHWNSTIGTELDKVIRNVKLVILLTRYFLEVLSFVILSNLLYLKN